MTTNVPETGGHPVHLPHMTLALPPVITETEIRDTLSRVYDPEFGISVQDMGLIYDVAIQGDDVTIAMTLTSQYCPAGDMMVDGVRAAVAALPRVATVDVRLVWEPQWSPALLSAPARDQLGFPADQTDA